MSGGESPQADNLFKKEEIVMKLTLKLKNPNEIKKFVDITSQFGEDLSLVHDRFVVDAKSILGIFSMDLSKPIDLVSDTENENLAVALKEFVVA